MGSPKDKTDDLASPQPNGHEGMISALLRELRENSVALATFGADQRILREKVERLSGILKDGDGEKSLLTRVVLLESDLGDLKKASEKAESKIDKLNDTSANLVYEDRKDLRENKRQQMQVWIAVITALAGAAIAVITNIYAHH